MDTQTNNKVLYKNDVFWKDFIELYKSLPAVWQVKNEKLYKNRTLKHKNYGMLLKKYQEVCPKATLDEVKKKINVMRTNFRKEVKKIKDSERSGCGAEEVYVSRMKHFSDLSFLMDQEEQEEGVSSMQLEENIDTDVEIQKRAKEPSQKTKQKRDELLSKAMQHLESQPKPDEGTQFGNFVGTLYNNLEKKQRILANMLIQQVLTEGALGRLTEGTHLQMQPTPSPPPIYRVRTPLANQNLYNTPNPNRVRTPPYIITSYRSTPLNSNERSYRPRQQRSYTERQYDYSSNNFDEPSPFNTETTSKYDDELPLSEDLNDSYAMTRPPNIEIIQDTVQPTTYHYSSAQELFNEFDYS